MRVNIYAEEMTDRVEVVEKTTADGTKYMLEDDSWVLMRTSGTEPVVRLYVESSSEANMRELTEAGKKFILGQ
jgi:phosphoglucomutase